MMKWKIGLIVGAVFGGLAYPLLILGLVVALPGILEKVYVVILFIMYLPAILAGKVGMDFGIYSFVIMSIGWAIIGGGIGYLIDKLKR